MCYFFQSLHRFSGQENWTRDVHLCTTCGLGFTSGNLLAAHRVNCTDEKRHSQRKSNVKSEKVPQESNGKKLFRCDRCDRQFTQWGAVATHVKTVHDKIREFKCPTCGAEFGHEHNLQRHILTVHQKIRDFPCSECGQRFTQSGHLKTHIDSVHLQEKHPCDQCDYQATTARYLARHKKRIHTGGPSVPCLFCPAMFALPTQAKSHAKNVHREVKFPLFFYIFILHNHLY
jgi:KRAB domain-containing zinc finger protein